jgi:hypothetical protein
MNESQLRIIRAMQWVFYPVALVLLGAFAWDVVSDSESDLFATASGVLGNVGDPFALGVVLLFWVVFAALLIEFVKREVTGAFKRSNLGAVLLEISAPKAVIRFLLPLIALQFVAGLNVIVFAGEFLEIDPGEADLAVQLVFWLFYGIGHFLFLAFLLRAVRNRPFFVLSDRGFIYEPGDLSPGLVLWRDVESLKEVDLLAGDTNSGGPAMRRTLVVSLRDPDKYLTRFNPLLRLLYGLLIRVVRIQADGSGDIVVDAGDFGRRYDEARALMAQRVAKGGGAVSLFET